MIYRCRELSFTYKFGRQLIPGLRGINLDIAKGAFICFTGPSGSGKSTLLNLLGLIEVVQKGELLFEGQNLGTINEHQRNHIRRHQLGFVFQSFHLIEVLDAFENVAFFLSRQGLAREERESRTAEALKAVGLWEHRHKRPGEMSGGQRQRVAVARALAKRPDVVIADEPTASLDQENGRQIMQLLRDIRDHHGVTIIMSSHDPMAQSFASEKLRLVDGRLC